MKPRPIARMCALSKVAPFGSAQLNTRSAHLIVTGIFVVLCGIEIVSDATT